MRVLAYPADSFGCGHHRLIWPAAVLRAQGVDVTVVEAQNRVLQLHMRNDELVDLELPGDVDVVVFQRLTDRRLIQAVPLLRSRGVAVVIDVDDDLSAIHPANPAWQYLDPNRAQREVKALLEQGRIRPAQVTAVRQQLDNGYSHSWTNLQLACRDATLVTCSTPALLTRYARHGRGHVLDNYAPDHYLEVAHDDGDLLGWPATLHSHPNDPPALGNAVTRLVSEGYRFTTIGGSTDVAHAFGLPDEPASLGEATLEQWPAYLTQLGVGVAPLADTRFNAAKSRLKVLEMAAVGVPWVASPRAEYVKLHRLGAGVLAEKPRDWYRALHRLLDEPAYRQELSLAGRAVAEQLRLSDHAWRWAEAWQRAFDLQRQASAAPKASLVVGPS